MSCYLKIRFANASIASSPSEKLLGISLDSELKFEEYINKICNIVNNKLNVLHRIGSHMTKWKMLLRAFIESQFSYCSLIWMFHSKTLNNKINLNKSKFDELLEKDSSFSIHHRNIHHRSIHYRNIWLLKYLNFWMEYPHKLWMKSSRLNRQPHSIWEIKMNCIVEIPKQWRLGLRQSRLWHLKSAQ